MSVADNNDSNNSTASNHSPEVAEKLRAIRERLTRRLARPVLKAPELTLPSLEPLQDARTWASSLAGAIGTVNPRSPGLINNLLQAGKRTLASLLDWTHRPQRDFNRAVVESMGRTSEVLESTNRNLLALAEAIGRSGEMDRRMGEEMDSLFDQFEEKMKLQRWAYDGALARQSTALQDRTYELLGELQEQLLEEVRILRQRLVAQSRAESVRLTGATPAEGAKSATSFPAGIDYFQLERHFRGTEVEVRTRQSFYLPFFEGRKNVLDIACGRGEFLDLMREAKVTARGVDLNADMVGLCLEKGLNVVQADVFSFLNTLPDGSLDGIFCSQFVEHLEAEAYVRLLSQCAEKLAPAGILAVETQNPECLAIFSQTFFLDPTHVRPIPPALLRILFAEAGLERITTHFLSPAAAGLPVVPKLASGVIEPDALKAWNAAVTQFNETFFGGMDYAVVGYRPDSSSTDSSAGSGKTRRRIGG